MIPSLTTSSDNIPYKNFSSESSEDSSPQQTKIVTLAKTNIPKNVTQQKRKPKDLSQISFGIVKNTETFAETADVPQRNKRIYSEDGKNKKKKNKCNIL